MQKLKILFTLKFLLFQGLLFAQSEEVIKIDGNLELFVDHYLVEKLTDAKFILHTPKDEGVVFYFDKPWEGAFSAYFTILKDGSDFKAHYRGIPNSGMDGNEEELTCYAESKDGIHWVKPDLGIHEIGGSKNNNVILAKQALVTHNFSPFLDKNPNVKKSEKYKALGGTRKSGLIAFVSSDGKRWKKVQETPVINEGNLDSQNVSFWSEKEKKYLCYFRTSDSGFRSVSRTESMDFLHWEKGVSMSFGDRPLEHLYTQQTSPYFRAPHIYLAIGARFMPNRKVVSDQEAAMLNVDPKYYSDCSDVYLMSSRGGDQYERLFMESFIRPGIGLQNWVSRSNYPALNLVQTGENEMSIYVNQDYAQPSAHLRRYSMRLDGLGSLSAGYQGGELLTKAFTFVGDSLNLNYSTSAAGEIRIELLDLEGNKIPGFSMEESQALIGNEISSKVNWNGSSDVSGLVGKAVKMRIQLKDADIYSFQFR
ncbi:MAG: hypothetical protein WD398_06025 [Cyclobacteriaceae bacterium]